MLICFRVHLFLQEWEAQNQTESDSAHEQISTLEDQLRAEKRHREDVEFDLDKQKQVTIAVAEI